MKNIIKYLVPVIAVFVFSTGTNAQVSVGLSINIAPPVIPTYVQPDCPVDGYIWTPGYWAYGPDGYYWVPGAWVMPPQPGYLWTPGYWAYTGAFYRWHPGYWGMHVGYYGGINYGFGYFGDGFVGGMWHGGVFRYNTAVVNVNRTVIHNTYINKTVIVNNRGSRASFNGRGGITRQPNPVERRYMNEHHVGATSAQTRYQNTARNNHSQYFSNNHGLPQRTAVTHANTANRASVRQPNNVQHAQSNHVTQANNKITHPSTNHVQANHTPVNNKAARPNINRVQTNRAQVNHVQATRPAVSRQPVQRPANTRAHAGSAGRVAHPQQAERRR